MYTDMKFVRTSLEKNIEIFSTRSKIQLHLYFVLIHLSIKFEYGLRGKRH